MKPLVHTGDQETFETVDFTPRTCTEEGETVLSAGNVMATVFWLLQGVIDIDYLKMGNNDHRARLCRKIGSIRSRIAEKSASLGDEKSVVPQWRHTGSHSSVATAKMDELGYELLLHLSYSLGLAPCDVFLFLSLIKPLAGQKFEPN
ncbi:hypothetical protein PYW07_016557 [Mythimna separata]|uniref:Uncharacterized protein n=1 Tax=Mythimna separata TaxID=271217 RepID=A0AAD7YLW0_MYTSE|nr:hypothetical protein PYW07_016557 [Mythimna separata]